MSYTMLGGHGLTRAAASSLRTNLAAAVAVLNAEPDAPVQLADIPADNIVVYGRKRIAAGAPTMEVSAPAQRGTNPDIPARDVEATALVTVVTRVQEQGDFEALCERCHRYNAAVLAILSQPDACGLGTAMSEYIARVGEANLEDATRDAPPVANGLVAVRVTFTEGLELA